MEESGYAWAQPRDAELQEMYKNFMGNLENDKKLKNKLIKYFSTVFYLFR
ncbi:hypothetical protein [Clostridium sp. CF012]|nr:hypothetical protein [Clostridium sp. CF012]MBU3146263.1 hypothetical protein [Clostridium sp. CF012]